MYRTSQSPVLPALLCVLSVSVMIPSAFGADKAKLAEGKKTFETKCLKCHKPEKFKTQAHDKKGWEIVLNRMVRNNSCELNDREVDTLSDFLAENYGD